MKDTDMDFEFDLQLFGKGKSGGKILFSLVGAAFGWFNPGFFGLASSEMFGGAVMGMSLVSTIWSATHQNKADSSATINRFDKVQETMTSTCPIPIVYGTRLIAGNQTYHETNSDDQQLHKHVCLCEGGIQGIRSITANGLVVPTGTQTANTVFTLQNVKFSDARCSLHDKHLYLYANGKLRDIQLINKDNIDDDASYWDYQTSIQSLVSYINRLGEGWQAFPVAATNKYPGDIHNVEECGCYNVTPINFTMDTVTGGTTYTFHDNECPDTYETTGGYPGLAWLDMRFYASSELNGNPSVEVVVDGKKVYDPRTGRTEFSTNPACCLLDFLTAPRYGLGKWIPADMIDADSFKKGADYCDQIVTFHDSDGVIVKAKRYELNMVIDEKKDAISWLQEILANFGAYLVFSRGKFKLCMEMPTDVSYKFKPDEIKDFSITPLKSSETPNKWTISLVDPLNNWKVIKAVVEDFSDQYIKGRVVEKEVELTGVTSQNQALRLARYYRDYNLSCPFQIEFTTGLQAMHLEPGDVVTVPYRKVLVDMPIRIAEIEQSDENTFIIRGRQYNDSIYTDDLGGGIQWHKYTPADSGNLHIGTPLPITGVVAYTNTDNEILVEHNASQDSNFKEYRYYVEEVET